MLYVMKFSMDGCLVTIPERDKERFKALMGWSEEYFQDQVKMSGPDEDIIDIYNP